MEVRIDAEATLPAAGEHVESQEFEAFYGREWRSVLGLALALTGRPALAEELTQEAFLAAYRGWGRVGGYADPGAWVRRGVANRSVSALRRRLAEARGMVRLQREREVPVELVLPDESYWVAVRDLPPQQAKAVALRYACDLDTPAIARVLGCSEATVRVHLHRGLRALRERLADEEDR